MKLKLKFFNVRETSIPVRPLTVDTTLEVDLGREPTEEDNRRILEMERTFNELTSGRLHASIV